MVLLQEGKTAFHRDDFATASAKYEEVKRLTENRPELRDLASQASSHLALARFTDEVRARADSSFQGIAALRYRILDGQDTNGELVSLLAPFQVLDDLEWFKHPRLTVLNDSRRKRLVREVDELLFQFVVTLDPRERGSARRGIEICDRVLGFTDDKKPWQALRSWLDDSPLPTLSQDPASETSAKSCFEWALLDDRLGRVRSAEHWLDQASFLEPSNPWYEFRFATILCREDAEQAITHYRAAITSEPQNPRFLLDRAKAYRSIGEWNLATRDENQARKCTAKGTRP
jgi:tetratricopeptide (TPR) repeat protein